MPRMTRWRAVVARVTPVFSLGAASAAHAGSSSRAAGSPLLATVPPVPPGFTLSDLVADAAFATGASGFTPGSALDGAVGLDTTDPIEGSSSLHVTLNA